MPNRMVKGLIIEEPDEVQPASPEPVATSEYYTKENWRGSLFVFRCSNCGHCENSEDSMKIHVLNHVPEANKNKVLDTLIKGE